MALTACPSPSSHTLSSHQAALDIPARKVRTLQPNYTFEGNDCETVIDVHLPGVQRPDISIRLVGQHLIILGKCFESGKRSPPSLEYALHVQLDATVHRKDVKAAMRSFDTLVVRIPAVKE